jgi:hypothetical protein
VALRTSAQSTYIDRLPELLHNNNTRMKIISARCGLMTRQTHSNVIKAKKTGEKEEIHFDLTILI